MRPREADHVTDSGTLAAVNAAAAAIVTAQPRRAVALAYLAERGIDATALPETCLLGYAPPGWTRLTDVLRTGFSDQALLDAGVARRSSRGTLIDTFRDRIIFPLQTAAGSAVGFIGRDLSGNAGAPKYLNTHQNAVFDKRALLYGLPETPTGASTARQPVVVEGPIDAIAITSAAATTGNTKLLPVAACGTAFTAVHAQRVADIARRHRAPVVLAFDADPAGRNATIRAGDHFRRLGVDVGVANLSDGADPASHLAGTPDLITTFQASRAVPLLTVHVQRAVAMQGDRMQWVEGRIAAGRSVAAHLATYPSEYAAAQIGWIAESLGLSASTLTFEVARAFFDRPAERATEHQPNRALASHPSL